MQSQSQLNIFNDSFIQQSQSQSYYQQMPFNLDQLRFNRNQDSFVRLIHLPKASLSNISSLDLNQLAVQHIFSKQHGKITKPSKWHDNDVITVGRHQPYHNQTDISIDDKTVSLKHFKIDAREGWNKRKKLTSQFVVFLSGLRESKNSISKLNKDVLEIIWSYSKPINQFLIQDLGSKLGTCIRIQNKQIVKQGMIFKISYSIQIKIIDILKLKGEKLLSYLKQYQIQKQQQQFHLNSNLIQYNLEQDQQYNCIKLSVQNTKYVFINKQNIKILIGRHDSNDIVVNQQSISRRHCCIIYDGSAWTITDGINGNVSVNGVWRDLRTIEEADGKKKSMPIKLHHNDMIMAGKSFFKFAVHNC